MPTPETMRVLFLRRRVGKGALDQRLRGGPVEAHAALGRVHRLGDAESQAENMAAEGERRLPVDGRALTGFLRRERVGYDMHRRVCRGG